MVRLAIPAALLFFLACGVFLACGARTGLRVDGDGEGAGDTGGGGDGAGGEGEGGSDVGGVEQVALGGGHTCVRTIKGSVYCWGRNGSGQLGDKSVNGQSEVPVRVPLDGRAVFLDAGTNHTCAILENGALYCWGDNADLQIKSGEPEDVLSPVEVEGISTPVRSVALGEQHSCAIDSGGDLVCWGASGLGQAGALGGQVVSPGKVATTVIDVTAGSFHTCFISAGGAVRCMGANDDGECGVFVATPVLPPEIPEGLFGLEATAIEAGPGRHTCALIQGAIYCWGDNSTGQLGRGFATELELPNEVLGMPPGNVNGIAPGTTHTCALFDDDVYCWGDNFSGQLGVAGGSTSLPLAVGLSGIVAVGSGSVHSCAYASPTEIYCWGANSFGQLGNGESSSMTSLPVKVELP